MRTASALGIGASVALAMVAVFAAPAAAYKWPGTEASVGAAVSASVIGRKCAGILGASELAEIEAYLAKAASEWDADPANAGSSFATFVSGLSATYEAKYPAACGDATEEARDTLERVRKAMASGGRLLPVAGNPDGPPDMAQAIRAKIVAEKCDAALTAREWADLELYMAQSFVAFAKSATDADARQTFALYRSSERDIAGAWQAKDCAEASVKHAKAIVARARKALGAH
jgi:hypothetical protein